MNSKPSIFWKILDSYQILAFFLFLTGGGFLIQGGLQDLVAMKPWLHRSALAFLTMSGFILFAFQTHLYKTGKASEPVLTFLGRFFFSSVKVYTVFIFLSLAVMWTYSSWLRHDIFHSSFDMAIFTQAIWNTLDGHPLYSSIKGGINLLGDHFSPVLLLLSLPYAVWPDPKCLLLIQAMAMASCVFPILKLSQEEKLPLSWQYLMVTAFALYLPARNAVRFDFHPEIVTVPFFFWAFYLIQKQKDLLASFFLAIGLLSKEAAALTTFMFGLYGLSKRRYGFGLFWAILSPVYFFLAIQKWVPAFSGQDYFYLSGNFLAWQQEGWGNLLRQIFSIPNAVYLFKIYLPLAFLNFLDPAALLLSLPALLQNLTARNEQVRSIFFHYTAYLIPFAFIGTVRGAKKIAHLPWAPWLFAACMLLMSGVSEIYVIQQAAKQNQPRFNDIRQYLRRFPKEASLRTHELFAPHAAHRRNLYIYENHHPREGGSPEALAAAYPIVGRGQLLGEGGSPKALAAPYVILDRMFLGPLEKEAQQDLSSKGYHLIYEKEGFEVFQK